MSETEAVTMPGLLRLTAFGSNAPLFVTSDTRRWSSCTPYGGGSWIVVDRDPHHAAESPAQIDELIRAAQAPLPPAKPEQPSAVPPSIASGIIDKAEQHRKASEKACNAERSSQPPAGDYQSCCNPSQIDTSPPAADGLADDAEAVEAAGRIFWGDRFPEDVTATARGAFSMSLRAYFDVQAKALRERCEELEVFERAIKDRHNGYGSTGDPPATPSAALDQLIEEATELGKIEAKLSARPASGEGAGRCGELTEEQVEELWNQQRFGIKWSHLEECVRKDRVAFARACIARARAKAAVPFDVEAPIYSKHVGPGDPKQCIHCNDLIGAAKVALAAAGVAIKDTGR